MDATVPIPKYRREATGRARCIWCGWLVTEEGVTLPKEFDVPLRDDCPPRCSDTACVSYEVCGADGLVCRGTD